VGDEASTDPVTQRERRKRRRRQQEAANECGDAVPIDTTERRVPRRRAEERHESDAHPSWRLKAALENMDKLALVRPERPRIQPGPDNNAHEPIISNVVATAKCVNCVPNMQRLVWLLMGRRSHGEFARPVTVSLWPEGSTIAIQTTTGILNETGEKSEPAAVLGAWAYMEAVATHLRVPLSLASFEVYNMHATFRMGGPIDLRALHNAVEHSIYNPELIQCVSITIHDPRSTVLVWATGAVVVNGCKTREQHMRVYHEFGRFLAQFVRTPRTTTTTTAAAAAAPAESSHVQPLASPFTAPLPSPSPSPSPPPPAPAPSQPWRIELRPSLWDM